jgi:hypothetical protein
VASTRSSSGSRLTGAGSEGWYDDLGEARVVLHELDGGDAGVVNARGELPSADDLSELGK